MGRGGRILSRILDEPKEIEIVFGVPAAVEWKRYQCLVSVRKVGDKTEYDDVYVVEVPFAD